MKKNIIRVKKFQKTLICLLVISALILGFVVGKIMNANADEINYEYQSNNIGYDSTDSSLTATNVKDAIDELYSKVGKCPKGYECFTDEEVNANIISQTNILSAYKYDEDINSDSYCVTGEDDEKCKKTLCYLSKSRNACSSGTIIDYKVNDTETVRFHVLHDDGDTMTMQTQRTIVYGVAWYAGTNTTLNGPDTILTQLESQTNGWSNVKDIEYNGDNTKFVGVEELSNIPSDMKNNNNYCESYNSCTGNQYTYPTRTVKARMIMLQEAVDVGCTTSNSNYPKFMYNYLYDANLFNSSGNYGYWTMSVKGSGFVWRLNFGGVVGSHDASNINNGARAVVVVEK